MYIVWQKIKQDSQKQWEAEKLFQCTQTPHKCCKVVYLQSTLLCQLFSKSRAISVQWLGCRLDGRIPGNYNPGGSRSL